MRFLRSRLRRGTWVILVALLVGALVPASAHAWDPTPAPLVLSEVCSAQGSGPKAGMAAGQDDAGRTIHVDCIECCPSCVQCSPVQGSLLARIAAPASNAVDLRWTRRDDAPARAGPARCDSQPRAPPRAN